MNAGIKEIHGWMGDAELDYLHALVTDAPPDALIVELGAWKGRSTAALYTAIHDQQTVCTVDTWLGQADIRHGAHHEVLERDVFLKFLREMNAVGVSPAWWTRPQQGACYLRMFADDAATLFPDASIYAISIDADHNAVGHDVDTWRPKMAPTGIMCGHDWNWEGVQEQLEPRLSIAEVIGDMWIAKPLKEQSWYC